MIRIGRVVYAVATILRLFSFALLIPIPIAFAYDRPYDHMLWGRFAVPHAALTFAYAFLACAAAWVPARIATRKAGEEDLLDREAYLTVAVGWLVVTCFAMLPFLLSGVTRSPLNAFFEAMSGLTGTGSSVLPDLADVPPSVIFWRAFTQWLGGLGIIVLTVALLSKLTHGGLQLFRGEAGAATASRIKPKLAEVARGLWRMYGIITLLFIVLLAAALWYRLEVPALEAVFEAMVVTFSAYGNGAFESAAIGQALTDPLVKPILAVMMLAGATNFTLTFLLLRRGQSRPLLSNVEWRFFATWVVAMAVACMAILYFSPQFSAVRAVAEGAFTGISVATGTGLGAYHNGWPAAGTLLLFMMVLIGGMAGSAAGGLKAFRGLVLLRVVAREMRQVLHPRAILPLRVGANVVPEGAVRAVVAFFFTFLVLWVGGTFAILLSESATPGIGIVEASGAALAALGNVGIGFGSLTTSGPALLTPASKAILAALMWLGRMELFAALLLFAPKSWRT